MRTLTFRPWLLSMLCGGLWACGATPQTAQPSGAPPPAAVAAYAEATMLLQQGRMVEAAARYDAAAQADPGAAHLWLAAARARSALDEHDAALERAARAEAISPDDPQVASAYEDALRRAGRGDALKARLTERLTKHPEDARAGAAAAEALLEAQAFAEAEAVLEKSTRANPNAPKTWELLGKARMQLGAHLKAAEAFERARLLDPNRRFLDTLIVRLALEGGDNARALAAIKRIGGPSSTDAQAALALAGMLTERQDPVGASVVLEAALARAPDDAGLRLGLGRVLCSAERWADAEAALAAIPSGAEQRAEALQLRALAALESEAEGSLDKAYSLLETLRTERPEADRAALAAQRVRIRRAQARSAEARTMLDEARQRWPEDTSLHFLDGMLFEDLGQRTRALEVMQALIAREPEHAGALNYVGYSWAEQNVRLEEAETLIRRALQVSPSDAAIVDSLGWVMFRRGDLTGAEATLRRAIELDAEEGELHFHLAEVLAAARRFPEAVEAYDKALSLTKDSKLSAAWRKRKAAAQGKVKAAPRSTPR